MSTRLKPDALREYLDHRVGHQLTKYARLQLQRHGLRLEKLSGQKLYVIHGGTDPPGKTYTPEELRGLLVEIRRGEIEGR